MYNVNKHGAVVAIKITDDFKAEIRTAFGFTKTINWTNVAARKEFETGINGYTLFYDERRKRDFCDWNNHKGEINQ